MEVKKTADKKAYMREYKRKQYALKGDDMKERNAYSVLCSIKIWEQ